MSLEKMYTQDDDGTWISKAKCSDIDNNVFFPDLGPNYRKSVERAKLICEECEVQDECLGSAIKNGEGFGIWGGLTFDERKEMSRIQRKLPE